MLLSFAGSFSNASRVPAGSLANASSVGANTVNGPAPFKVPIRSVAFNAAASVLNVPADTAVSTMSFVGAWAADTPMERDRAAIIATRVLFVLRIIFVFLSYVERLFDPTKARVAGRVAVVNDISMTNSGQ